MENVNPKLELTHSLPKLPVPDLRHTMQRFMQTLQPLMTSQEHTNLAQLAETFMAPGGQGEQLQSALLKRQQELPNWSLEYWLHDMYMRVPLALPVNSNPGMVFPRRRFSDDEEMLVYTAHLVHGAYKWKIKVNKDGLPVDRCTSRTKGQSLCMEQYHRVMTTYRRPGNPRDFQLDTTEAQSEYIIVCCRGKQFQVYLAEDWEPLTVAEVALQLLKCQKMAAQTDKVGVHVGILTSDDRRVWAENRRALIEADELNADSLTTVENCLFVVCLDQRLPESFNGHKRVSFDSGPAPVGHRDASSMALQMIHGGGTLFNTANRWFDKTIQIVVSNDGVSGLCYEHSAAEGIVVVQLMEQLLDDADQDATILKDHQQQEHQERVLEPPIQLEWMVNDQILARIDKSTVSIDKLADDLDFLVSRYKDYGKNFIKSVRCSPDAYMQLTLQLAYFIKHGRLVSTYESASTRRYQQGRVDCIRAVTPQVMTWVKAMCKENNTRERKAELFRLALEAQTEIMVENITGLGIDIHLLGLREMAQQLKTPTPEICQHAGHQIANHFGLSTSQVPTKSEDTFMGYGPVVPDGYGCSYNIHADSIVFCIGSFHSCTVTSSSDFSSAIKQSLDSIKDLLADLH